jgi:hypothetical protein
MGRNRRLFLACWASAGRWHARARTSVECISSTERVPLKNSDARGLACEPSWRAAVADAYSPVWARYRDRTAVLFLLIVNYGPGLRAWWWYRMVLYRARCHNYFFA